MGRRASKFQARAEHDDTPLLPEKIIQIPSCIIVVFFVDFYSLKKNQHF